MATEPKQVDVNKYLNIDAEINTSRVERALRIYPETLREELLDGFDHIRKTFFKVLYNVTQLKDKRFLATKNAGIGRHIRVYRNPRKGDILDMELGIFSRSSVVKLHEEGGTVSAPAGRMLSIPILHGKDEQTGRTKTWFRGAKKNYKDFELFIIASHGRLLLVKKSGGKILPYFILKQKVKIQPRLRFYDTWNSIQGYRIEILNKSVDKALNKA